MSSEGGGLAGPQLELRRPLAEEHLDAVARGVGARSRASRRKRVCGGL